MNPVLPIFTFEIKIMITQIVQVKLIYEYSSFIRILLDPNLVTSTIKTQYVNEI